MTPEAAPASAWQAAVQAAADGTRATAHMHPRLGRASYLGERVWGVPDAGTSAVSVWIQSIASNLD